VTGNTSVNKANVNEHCSLTTAGAISSIAAAAQSELKPTLDRRELTLYVKENKWWDPTTPEFHHQLICSRGTNYRHSRANKS
jgi:hypothetical protein